MPDSKDSKEVALKYIKDQIITCQMMPGSTVQIDEISEKLNISKTPVREALLELQYDGYVTVIPRKKTVVSKISLQDLKDIYDARALMETHIIESISSAPTSDTASNEESLRLLQRTWKNIDITDHTRENYMAFLKADINFHLTLIRLYPNPYIVRFCQELIFKSQRFWYVALFNNDLAQVKEEHLQILDSLIAHNVPAAIEACQKHISISKALNILSD